MKGEKFSMDSELALIRHFVYADKENGILNPKIKRAFCHSLFRKKLNQKRNLELLKGSHQTI